MTNLAVNVCGLAMKNPTMLASGVFDETGKSMLAIAKAGAGAIVTKSIGKEPRTGYAGPNVVELPQALLNAMGLPNPGIEAYAAEIAEAKTAEVPIIGSVFGSDEQEFSELAKAMQAAGVAAVELNLSCPHAKGYGAEIGSTPEMVELVCKSVKESVTVPVFAKLTPNTANIISLAKAAEKGGADAIVAINTLKGMVISPEAKMPVLGNRFGGLSGSAIRPIGVRCVYEIYESVSIPIIGVGGVSTGREALEYLMAGAKGVQVGTAIWKEGPEVFSKICRELQLFMEEFGYSKLSEITGVAHHGRT